MNWAAMTRMDILRQVLYGGKRYVDDIKTSDAESVTVLERSYLPKDNHAFAKVYDPSVPGNQSGAVRLYTPYDHSAISFCNVSESSTGAPLIRVARGKWPSWSNTEAVQCEWSAESTNPDYRATNKHGLTTLHARISVCEAGKDVSSTRCMRYNDGSYKPVGLLQKNYRDIDFGLVSGTWGWESRRKGGVLRKKASRLAGNTGNNAVNEFDENTGKFNTNVVGIIGNIDKFRIAGNPGGNRANSIDWGNPIGEIYAETLRYLAGTGSATSGFVDSSGPTGITRVGTWDDPMATATECTNCSVIILSSGPNSWDGDDLTDAVLSNIVSGTTKNILDTNYTDKIGSLEFGGNQTYFNGGSTLSTQCSITTLTGLSDVSGLCPQEPTMEGTYAVSGLAFLARSNSIRSERDDAFVSTYAVELSQGLPNLRIPLGSGAISIVPICTASGHGNACSLTSVRVEDIQLVDSKPVKGSYLFFWEDNNQHNTTNDYDMDSVQRIEFCVGSYCDNFGDANHYRAANVYKEHASKFAESVEADELRIVNSIPYWATGAQMSATYLISGSSSDGLQNEWVRRGGYDAHNFVNAGGQPINSSVSSGTTTWYNTILPDGTDYLPRDNGTSRIYLQEKTFAVGTNSANKLESPLFYAAKYGNFVELDSAGAPVGWDVKNNVTGAVGADGLPDAYFSVNNPANLESSLSAVIDSIRAQNASGAAATTNSTSLDNGTVVYQALFNSPTWDGELRAVNVNANGDLGAEQWTTRSENAFPAPADRKIITYNGSAGVNFITANLNLLNGAQRNALGTTAEARRNIIRWMRGQAISGLRTRPNIDPDDSSSPINLLGDIVNSSPVFAGKQSQRFETLSAALGGTAYETFVAAKADRVNAVYVGANDGMLHAFNADTGRELFAYVPSTVYGKLRNIALPNYGISIPHTYTVDGPLYVGDAYYNGTWKTILVGTLGAGGRGIFVLDVTDPSEFGTDKVLFELTSADYPQLGNVLGQPYIAPVGNRWKLVFGNGYNSDGTAAHLFVIDLQFPKDSDYSQVIQAGANSNNGLASPALLPDANGVIAAAYAGDLLGNMWKFDLNAGTPAYSGQPLFTAKYDEVNPSTPQPITAAPTLGKKEASAGGSESVVVYFGTGKYLEQSDLTNLNVQSFYAIADPGAAVQIVTDRDGALHKKTISAQTATTRTVNDKASKIVDWANDDGWYVDLLPPSGVAEGERVVTKPILRYDRVLFPTLIPSGESCSFGGGGWLMEFAGVGDRYLGYTILGADGKKTENFLTGLTTATGDDKIVVVSNDIAGELETHGAGKPTDALDKGRMSWKQLR